MISPFVAHAIAKEGLDSVAGAIRALAEAQIQAKRMKTAVWIIEHKNVLDVDLVKQAEGLLKREVR